MPPNLEAESKERILAALNRLNEIPDFLARQMDLVRENRERWLQPVLETQKGMAYRIDIFHGLEDELSLEKKLVQDIIDVRPPTGVHIPEAIEELRELAVTTLGLIEKMHTTGDPKLIPEIVSSNYSFKMNLSNYIDYLESELKNWAGKGLEKFRLVLEDRATLEQQAPYILKAEN